MAWRLAIACVGLAATIAFVASAAFDRHAPSGVDPASYSIDPDFGVSKEKPIKVGGADGSNGPTAESSYLKSLRDRTGMPVTFRRRMSVGRGSDDHVLDLFDVSTSTGEKFMLYLDMYHPEEPPSRQKAPIGLFKTSATK